MGDLLLPTKGDYTLKDIVIPGAHDAGMYVLTAAGGQQQGTINECNTLTQVTNISDQLNAGIRMFDLRVGIFNREMYIKHCASDCMEDAIGGGYGGRLRDMLFEIKDFIRQNNKEIVLLTFSHFCEKEIGPESLADSIVRYLGKDILFERKEDTPLNKIPLKEMAGKVILSFENYDGKNRCISSGTIADASGAFINFRRMYAVTNDPKKLWQREEFFLKHYPVCGKTIWFVWIGN